MKKVYLEPESGVIWDTADACFVEAMAVCYDLAMKASMGIGVPEVLKDATTEPEAAHLRNVLRRVMVILSGDLVEPLRTNQVLGAVSEALSRPRTNGTVIDKLTKENGDLQSEVLDLRLRLQGVIPPPGFLKRLWRRIFS